MSNRKKLLDALLGGPATYDELVDAIQEFQGRKLKDTISDCKKIGLIKLEMDVTGLPAYRLTPAGHGWLKDNPKFVTKKASAKPAPVGDAVIEPTPHDDVLAVASSDEMPTDKACCNAAKVVATTAGAEVAALREMKDRHARDLESILSANRKFCAWVSELVGGEKYPLNLSECQGIIHGIVDSASDACDEYRNDASAARAELDGYKSLAELYGIGNTLNDLHEHIAGLKSRIATLEGNASLPLENARDMKSTAVINESLTTDFVEHPPHYTAGQIECIDAIQSALTPDEYRGYIKGNALKYIWRERHKGGGESLAKAQWYLRRAA